MTPISLPDNCGKTETLPLEACPDLEVLCSDVGTLLEKAEVISIPAEFDPGSLDGEHFLTVRYRMPRPDGKVDVELQAYNFVGFLGSGELNVEIRSRFSADGGTDYFLLYLLSRTLNMHFVDLCHAIGPQLNPLQLSMLLFPSMLGRALRQGIFRKYVSEARNDMRFSGPLDAARHLRLNVPFGGRVAYRKREYSADNPVTQLIRHTAEFIKDCSYLGRILLENSATKRALSAIGAATPTYSKAMRRKVVSENLRPIANPYWTQYEQLRRLCLKILNHDSEYYRPDSTRRAHGLLINMAWLWEEYLDRLLRPCGFRHPSNTRRTGALHLADDGFRTLYPDFYSAGDGGIVIDAKYKLYVDERSDVFQMTTYLYRLKGRHGIFIHPSIGVRTPEFHRLKGYDATMGKLALAVPADAATPVAFAARIAEAEKQLLAQVQQL